MENLIYIIPMLAFLSACGVALPHGQSRPTARAPQAIGDGPIEGKFLTPEGDTIDLAKDAKRIQVVMFVSETCSVCRRDTKNLVADHVARGVPKNVDFYSIVVGSVAEDASDWKEGLKVDWTVGVDPGDALFKNYCPEHQTPCLLLHNPVLDKITKLVGEHSLKELEDTTGKWEL